MWSLLHYTTESYRSYLRASKKKKKKKKKTEKGIEAQTKEKDNGKACVRVAECEEVDDREEAWGTVYVSVFICRGGNWPDTNKPEGWGHISYVGALQVF